MRAGAANAAPAFEDKQRILKLYRANARQAEE